MAQVKFKDAVYRLDELEGKTTKEIQKLLGWSKEETARIQLSKWRASKKINFKIKQGVYTGFELLDNKTLKELENIEELKALAEFKITLYVEDVVNMRAIANNPAIKASERIKATESKHRALKHLEGTSAIAELKRHGLVG